MSFAVDWTAVTIAIFTGFIFLFLLQIKKQQTTSFLYHSHLLPITKTSWKMRFAKLPKLLKYLALIFMLFAFIDPHLTNNKTDKPNNNQQITKQPKIEKVSCPTKGLAIYFVLDKSSSMKQEMSFIDEKGLCFQIPRIEVLKKVTTNFINGNPKENMEARKDDLLGLVTFARCAQIISPLTLDQKSIHKSLANITTVNAQDEDGTAIGYAILKTVRLITATNHFAKDLIKKGKPAYEIKNNIIILITDGLQNPNPADVGHKLRTMSVVEAAKQAHKEKIPLYIIHIDPTNLQKWPEDFLALQQAAKITRGQFYTANNFQELEMAYREISKLEKNAFKKDIFATTKKFSSKKRGDKNIRIYSFYPLLITIALIAFLLSVMLETTILRRVP